MKVNNGENFLTIKAVRTDYYYKESLNVILCYLIILISCNKWSWNSPSTRDTGGTRMNETWSLVFRNSLYIETKNMALGSRLAGLNPGSTIYWLCGLRQVT